MIAWLFGAVEELPLDWKEYNELDSGNDFARAREQSDRNQRNLVAYQFKRAAMSNTEASCPRI